MKPLTIIYWTRACLGVIIGLLCAVYVYFSVTSELVGLYTLLTGLSFAMLFYIATFYPIKFKFFTRVEKPSKLITQGIGIYFFAWIVSWTLIVTLLMPSVTVNIYNNDTETLAEGQEFWVVAWNSANQVIQNVTTTTGSLRMALLPPGTYVFQLGGNLTQYNVVNQNQKLVIDWLQTRNVVFNVSG